MCREILTYIFKEGSIKLDRKRMMALYKQALLLHKAIEINNSQTFYSLLNHSNHHVQQLLE